MVRIAGSAVGWFGFTLGFVLLFQVSLAVMELGGACASGGAYEIEVECPERVALFAPTSIGIGLAAVGVWLFFSGGFGTPLAGWAWFVLFGGLSIPFALGGGGGWVIAVVFFIMGIVPLGLELRANPVRTLIGAYTVNHEPFAFGDNSRRSLLSATAPLDGEVAPTAVHWLLGLGVPLAASVLGVLAGVALF
jgi:hypothetical protein